MRYKPEHKKETHQRIVEAAAQEFRAHGFEGVGIAKLMGALDLTHGGFYAHFADKEALVAEVSVLALDQSLRRMLSALERGGIPGLLDFYLSEGHRDEVATGCPLPALTAEIARSAPASREAFTQKLSLLFDAVVTHMPGTTDAQRRSQVMTIFSAMTGAVSLSRAVADPDFSRAILTSTQENLLCLFNQEAPVA